jgi:protein TonB
MQKSIRDELARNEKLRKGEYKAVVAIWISQDGRVERFELLGSSGEPVVDAALKKVLGSIRQFDEPPSDMPQPVKLRISSR